MLMAVKTHKYSLIQFDALVCVCAMITSHKQITMQYVSPTSNIKADELKENPNLKHHLRRRSKVKSSMLIQRIQIKRKKDHLSLQFCLAVNKFSKKKSENKKAAKNKTKRKIHLKKSQHQQILHFDLDLYVVFFLCFFFYCYAAPFWRTSDVDFLIRNISQLDCNSSQT